MSVLQALEANLVSNTQRVSGECGWSPSAKAPRAAEFCLTLPKYCKTFGSPKYYRDKYLSILIIKLINLNYFFIFILKREKKRKKKKKA